MGIRKRIKILDSEDEISAELVAAYIEVLSYKTAITGSGSTLMAVPVRMMLLNWAKVFGRSLKEDGQYVLVSARGRTREINQEVYSFRGEVSSALYYRNVEPISKHPAQVVSRLQLIEA